MSLSVRNLEDGATKTYTSRANAEKKQSRRAEMSSSVRPPNPIDRRWIPRCNPTARTKRICQLPLFSLPKGDRRTIFDQAHRQPEEHVAWTVEATPCKVQAETKLHSQASAPISLPFAKHHTNPRIVDNCITTLVSFSPPSCPRTAAPLDCTAPDQTSSAPRSRRHRREYRDPRSAHKSRASSPRPDRDSALQSPGSRCIRMGCSCSFARTCSSSSPAIAGERDKDSRVHQKILVKRSLGHNRELTEREFECERH